ncbi:MAG: MBL fold metallo-hydrolase [Planctomycetaceae bacterium]|nr:MBL fold metallo-hydrolase [Planctomycetaceae bacterium]
MPPGHDTAGGSAEESAGESSSTAEDPLVRPHLILTGTGTSVGVPVVGCQCDVCLSDNPRNRRLRSGVLIRAPGGDMVIDTGPELRLQLLENNVRIVRAALFTHAHADHIMGLDDLRICSFRLEHEVIQLARSAVAERGEAFDESAFLKTGAGRIPLYCEANVEESLRHTFHYAFDSDTVPSHRYAVPRLEFVSVQPGEQRDILGLSVIPVRLHHGRLPILGFRIGNTAFCTDVSSIPAESRELLTDLDTLILDALRYEPHPTHFHVEQAVKWARRLKARRTVLTHMAHDLDFDRLTAELPDGIEPGYDGLRIEL